MTDEQHAQVVQDNLRLIDRCQDLECDLALYKKVLGKCESVADCMEDNARTMSSIGHAWIAAENVLVYARKIKDACDDVDSDPQEVKPGDMTTCSAYDLISEEDRETLRWVREHGGFDAVETQWDNCTQLADAVIYALWPYGLPDGEGNEYIMEELSKRLMPEGMEWLVEAWPRFEDDAPVRFLDDFERYGEEDGISAVTMYSDGSFALNFRAYSKGEHVNRPAPKALDADGAEIRVGDEVFVIETGKIHHVATIDPVGKRFKSMEQMSGDTSWLDPVCFTHRAPILAADGLPLSEGEKPYRVDNGKQVEIRRIDPSNGESCVFVGVDGRSYGYWLLPDQLTHERPESKCRDCANWQKDPTADNMGVCWFYYHEREGRDCYAARLGDIGACEEFVPRGKALAERDA